MLGMLVVAGVIGLVLAIIILGELSESRFRRRHDTGGPVVEVHGGQLPEPLIPSTIQRNAANG
jgi:hypothetical protein